MSAGVVAIFIDNSLVSWEFGRLEKQWWNYVHLSGFSEGSYMIVLCSKLRRSNIRTLPSARQLTKTSTLFAQNRTSKTSLS